MNHWSISKRSPVTLKGGLLAFRFQLQVATPEGAVFQWRGCLTGISPVAGPFVSLPRSGRFENCKWNERAQQICLDALRDAGVLDELVTKERAKFDYPDLNWEVSRD